MAGTNAKYKDHKVRHVCIKRLSEDAVIPTRSNLTDAGYDLYVPHAFLIMPHTRSLVPTHISMAIPDGYAGLIWDRSGLAVKKGLHRAAGVIDSGYRGEIKVCMHNSSHGRGWWPYDHTKYKIKSGDKIAQIIIHKIPEITLTEVDELSESNRGKLGFGSSDKKSI